MFYGEIAASELRLSRVGLDAAAAFTGAGLFSVDGTIISPIAWSAEAGFAGAGSLSADGALSNLFWVGEASFAGVGSLSVDGDLTSPIKLGEASFAGSGAMVASGFWLDGHIAYSQSLDNDGSTSFDGSSQRCIFTINEAASQIRIKVQSSSVNAMVVDHVSIGKQNTTYNTIATPVEIKFGGSSGFSIAAGQTTTSDWTNFSIAQSDVVVIIIDANSAANNATRYTLSAGLRYFMDPASSWDQSSPAGSWLNDTRALAIYEIDVR